MTKLKTFFLCVGEPSGDNLGADLMVSLKALYGPQTQFLGIGGPEMQAQGLISEFPIEELGLIGIFELIPHIFRVKKRINQLADKIITSKPDAFIGIDCGGINMRIMKILKDQGATTPCFQYSAPQVWAWREHRAKKMAQIADHLLCLLPFEPPYFTKHGLQTTFVGHPITSLKDKYPQDASFRKRHNLSDAPLICVLPGSRKSEVIRLIPVFKETIDIVKKTFPDIQIIFPTIPSLEHEIRKFAQQLDITTRVVTVREEKIGAFCESVAALAASGTVTLELATCNTPCVVGYKVNPLSYWIGRLLIKVNYISIINILNKQKVLPELLQKECTPEKLAKALITLMQHPSKVQPQLDKAIQMLSPPNAGLSASDMAALEIFKKI